ncbi:MAG: hypothetical protein R3B70_15025 [Polyangiaceae bacterium]
MSSPETSLLPDWLRRHRRWIGALLAAQVLAAGWLFLGVYEDREFDQHYLFVKGRPSAKWAFRAPVGEGDDDGVTLTENEWAEEMAFREHVEKLGGYERAVLLPW